jgi:hypothetical protein
MSCSDVKQTRKKYLQKGLNKAAELFLAARGTGASRTSKGIEKLVIVIKLAIRMVASQLLVLY